MKIRPLLSRVLVRLIEDQEKTASGIFVPKNSENRIWAKGFVVDAGPGENQFGLFVQNSVQKGDTVLFIRPWDGQKIVDGTDILFMINKEDVLGIIEEQ